MADRHGKLLPRNILQSPPNLQIRVCWRAFSRNVFPAWRSICDIQNIDIFILIDHLQYRFFGDYLRLCAFLLLLSFTSIYVDFLNFEFGAWWPVCCSLQHQRSSLDNAFTMNNCQLDTSPLPIHRYFANAPAIPIKVLRNHTSQKKKWLVLFLRDDLAFFLLKFGLMQGHSSFLPHILRLVFSVEGLLLSLTRATSFVLCITIAFLLP